MFHPKVLILEFAQLFPSYFELADAISFLWRAITANDADLFAEACWFLQIFDQLCCFADIIY